MPADYKNLLRAKGCECSDPGCPTHSGDSKCDRIATERLYRVDMDDESGACFCGECGDDAFGSGLFVGEATR